MNISEYLNKLSDFLTINRIILPNVITLIIVVILLYLALKGGLEFKGILLIYGIAMSILTLLGIDSVFNILTILGYLITELINAVFLVVL